jgi:hypothetical protein
MRLLEKERTAPAHVLQGTDGDAYTADGQEAFERDRKTQDAVNWLWLLTVNSELVADCPLKTQVSADPDDDKFIACALSSGSKIICTGR